MAKEPASWRVAKIILGVIGTVILGALGSGLWEIFFRPSMGVAGDFFISISDFIESSVYTTAALDPTPVSGLITLLCLTQAPLFFP